MPLLYFHSERKGVFFSDLDQHFMVAKTASMYVDKADLSSIDKDELHWIQDGLKIQINLLRQENALPA